MPKWSRKIKSDMLKRNPCPVERYGVIVVLAVSQIKHLFQKKRKIFLNKGSHRLKDRANHYQEIFGFE